MKKYSENILGHIDRIITWIKNKNTKDRIEITRFGIDALIWLKKRIEEFMSEFETL